MRRLFSTFDWGDGVLAPSGIYIAYSAEVAVVLDPGVGDLHRYNSGGGASSALESKKRCRGRGALGDLGSLGGVAPIDGEFESSASIAETLFLL